jgi:hypothetical protein
MKKFFIAIVAILVVIFFLGSCRKDSSGNTMDPAKERIFLFQLYTDKDLSGENSLVDFSVFIRTASKIIFDSAFTSLPLKDIPDAAHKLALEKTITVYGNEDLAAGFRYTIHNIGNSSFVDTSKAGNGFKIIDFNFQ